VRIFGIPAMARPGILPPPEAATDHAPHSDIRELGPNDETKRLHKRDLSAEPTRSETREISPREAPMQSDVRELTSPFEDLTDVDSAWDDTEPPSCARAREAMPSVEYAAPTPRPSLPTRPDAVRSSMAPARGYGYRASQFPDLAGQMRTRFAEGDFSGALVFAEAVLESDPTNTEGKIYVESCRAGLRESYLRHLGGEDAIPFLACRKEDLGRRDLDPKAGFVASRVDGASTIGEIVDGCGLSQDEALRALYELLCTAVITVLQPR
jgi:hypothetical protein